MAPRQRKHKKRGGKKKALSTAELLLNTSLFGGITPPINTSIADKDGTIHENGKEEITDNQEDIQRSENKLQIVQSKADDNVAIDSTVNSDKINEIRAKCFDDTSEVLVNENFVPSSSSVKPEYTIVDTTSGNIRRKVPLLRKEQNLQSASIELTQTDLQMLKNTMGSTFDSILKKFSFGEVNYEDEHMDESDNEVASTSSEEEWEKESVDSEESEEDYPRKFNLSDISELSDFGEYNEYIDHILSKLSLKRLKKLARPTVAELKLRTNKPEVVEQHDENSTDPLLLIYLKSCRNSVPVPQHWSLDRKYLSSKRGFEKPPFELPDFIKDTGIQEIREKYEKKQQEKSSKAIAKERMRAKLSRTDIDYQILHDAFFKYAKKPPLTIHGDIYYEGKENLIHAKQFQPGKLSEELRTALGMPEGAPPPWLIHMQRHGPPPSYPYLKIPGLNAPIPTGAKWGFHPGGWGKPPLDVTGKPLYGDVFADKPPEEEKKVEYWGEMKDDYYESSDEEESSEEEEEVTREAEEPHQKQPPKDITITSTIRSIDRPKELMTVLKEESVSVVDQDGILNTEKRYILPEGYIRNTEISNPEFHAQVEKSAEDMEMEEWIQQKEEDRQTYNATIEEAMALEEETQKRKRKEVEKEKARKRMKF